MILKEYFIELYKLRTKKENITDKELNNFLRKMNLTIRTTQKLIEQKINEYVKTEK